MRLPVEDRPARLAIILGCAAALSACGLETGGGRPSAYAAALPANGPQADYPVVVGEPYAVDGVAYTPEDVLNYDEVGFAALDQSGGDTISGAHHTLPLPSYVEVTSLETGRTILLRMERRGPMGGNQLIALSPGAAAQLAASSGTSVRVRRVNPPEDQRAVLRAGQAAPLRMDTPMSLVTVLKRKLPEQAQQASPAAIAAVTPPQELQRAEIAPVIEVAPVLASQTAASKGSAAETVPEQSQFAEAFAPAVVEVQPAETEGGFMVQAAAFSTADRARNAANMLDASVSPSGKYFRVRTGPFATRSQAEASLAKIKAAGYKDARIYTSG